VAAEHPQVHRGQPVGPQRRQVLFDVGAQLVGLLCGQPVGLVVALATDLADQRQIGGVGVQRFADEFVGDVRAVELRGVDVVDAEFDRAPEHRDGLLVIPRRAEDPGSGQLHGAEADAADSVGSEGEAVHVSYLHGFGAVSSAVAERNRAEGESVSPPFGSVLISALRGQICQSAESAVC